MEDLDCAIVTKEQAVKSTPDGDPARAMFLNNLGNALQSRFEQTGSMEDLDRAVVTDEQAVESTPYDNPARAARLNNLGNALQRRFEMTGSMEDLERAIVTKEEALKCDTAQPSIRLTAASSCSDLLISQRSYDRAKPILQAALRLLPTVSPRELRRSDQQWNISRFANITSRAVSLSLADAEDPYNTLQMLELGRGILATLQLDVRSDISVLAASYPDLAQQFQDLRERIDSSARTFNSRSVIVDSPVTFNSAFGSSIFVNTYRTSVKQFDELLLSIRSIGGFENFLLGPSESELRHLAEDGPIVAFNISDIRSDAFLITADNIRSLHLPLLTSDSLEHFGKRFVTAVNNRHLRLYSHSLREVNVVLQWVWDVAVSPILDQLGFTQMPPHGEAWPRVWWVGNGLLNILPIHAAGYHDSPSLKTALDRVISSYAPTVKSLSYARERERAARATIKEKAILVAMPTTPEQKNLPYVKIEVKDLGNVLSKVSIDTRVMWNPTRTDVLSELPKHTIVHFACHGHSEDDPSQSSLLLEDWKIRPLTVTDLMSLNIESAKFAYLSACHTSAMQNFRLLDESISLSSAIHLLGYPSIVASLWQIMDSHSAEVTKDVYAWISEEGRLDPRRAAEGLHRAVCDLRNRTRKQDPLVWAPFIHVGI